MSRGETNSWECAAGAGGQRGEGAADGKQLRDLPPQSSSRQLTPQQSATRRQQLLELIIAHQQQTEPSSSSSSASAAGGGGASFPIWAAEATVVSDRSFFVDEASSRRHRYSSSSSSGSRSSRPFWDRRGSPRAASTSGHRRQRSAGKLRLRLAWPMDTDKTTPRSKWILGQAAVEEDAGFINTSDDHSKARRRCSKSSAAAGMVGETPYFRVYPATAGGNPHQPGHARRTVSLPPTCATRGSSPRARPCLSAVAAVAIIRVFFSLGNSTAFVTQLRCC